MKRKTIYQGLYSLLLSCEVQGKAIFFYQMCAGENYQLSMNCNWRKKDELNGRQHHLNNELGA